MKTFVTYLAAGALGLLSHYFFGSLDVVSRVCEVTLSVMAIAAVPLTSITLASGVASALRPGREKGLLKTMALFSLCAAVLCTLSGVVAGTIFPASVTASLQGASGVFVFLENPLSAYAVLIYVIFAAVVVGINFRPTANIYVSAYNALNSLSEVCYRLMRGLSRFFFICVFFFAFYFSSSFSVPLKSVLPLLGFGAFLALVLLPLLFSVFTSFKVNPYRIFVHFLPAMLSGLFSQSYTFSFPSLYTDARYNAGIQKRFSSVSIPFSYFAGRAGTAAFTAFAVLSLLPSASLSVKGLLILISVFSSLCSPFGSPVEILFTVTIALRLLGFEDPAALSSLCSLLPVLSGLCIMIDIEVSGFTCAYTADRKGAMCRICTNDLV